MDRLIEFIIRMIRNRAFQHIFFWVVSYLVFFAIVRFRSPIDFTAKFVTGVVVPLIIPVYLHFLILRNLFETQKYFIYSVLLILIVVGSELLAQQFISFLFQDDFQTFLSLPAIITFIVVTTSIRSLKRSYLEQIRMKEIEQKRVETELKLLRSQINPHFLFNTLNNQYSLALSGSELTAPAILKLSQLLRYSLDSSESNFVSLSDEVEFIRNYIDLESLRLDIDTDININIKGEINDIDIAPLVISPLVENAFIHGIDSTTGNFTLNIDIDIMNNELVVRVFNTCPLKSEREGDRAGTGLTNLKSRLELIYSSGYDLKISKRKGTFYVVLRIKQ